MPVARRPASTAPDQRPSLRRDREPILLRPAAPPPRPLHDPDYWLREDTLVEPPLERHGAVAGQAPGEGQDSEDEDARAGSRRAARWLLLLAVLLPLSALAAWGVTQPGPWRRPEGARMATGEARPVPAASIVPPSEPPSATVRAAAAEPATPADAPAPPRSTAPERLAASRAVPRNPRCALLIRTAQLGVPMEVTDLAYLSRVCAPD